MNLSPFCFRVPSLHAFQRISGILFLTKTEGKFYQSLSRVQLSVTPWTAACQASLSFTISWSLLKLMSIRQWCHPTISYLLPPSPLALNLSQHQGLQAILSPDWASSSPAFCMMYSAYKLNKQGDNIPALTYSSPNFEPVSCSIYSSNCCFLTCIQVSQEAGKVVWYSHLFKNFLQFVVIYTITGFGLVNKAEVDFLMELLLFLWSNRYWQLDLWFLCLFQILLEYLEVFGSHTVEASLGEFRAFLC